jgi:[glutamine synthetase] adenylyltransferase / [glutamine synthetase]-adenylyl-L-tyrosine phosphorylase
MRPEFSTVRFLDRLRADANLSRLGALLPPKLLAPLASLLALSPDPDAALNLLERYAEKAPPEMLADLGRVPTALTYLVAIFGYSASLAETFLTEPALPLQFARDKNFTKLKSRDELMQDYARFATTNPDPWLSEQLVRFKRRNYLRIVLKDVLRVSTLAETTLELSALADVILANALTYCNQELARRYGRPQYRDPQGRIAQAGFSVISLGKLGGNELNYSSDIDLLFLYSHDGETAGGNDPDSTVYNKEYFVRLANAITRTITQSTPRGQAFRVDLRLRPEGEQGDLTISLRSALEYYEHRARDWELQMLIKARHSAGDEKLTREFLRGVEPYVYGSPADFSAIESVLLARERISKRLRESRADTVDVKRHRGGIRDIEFLTQCLQRLHGGRDHWVRSGGTLLALRKLNDKGCITDRDYASLNTTYEFLRRVEHAIQLDSGQQSHRLPVGEAALDRLARQLGIDAQAAHSAARSRPGAILQHRVRGVFKRVDAIYERVIHPRATAAGADAYQLKPPEPLWDDAAGASFGMIVDFLEARAPELGPVVRQADLPGGVRSHAAALLGKLLSSAEIFRIVRENPLRLERALMVLRFSDFMAELLIHHPEDLAAIGEDYDDGFRAPAEQIVIPLNAGDTPSDTPVADPFPWVTESGWDARRQMAVLRKHFRVRSLALSCRDVTAMPSVFASLSRWSALAARSVSSALWVAWRESLEHHAITVPHNPRPGELPIVVLAMGRLGISEFDLASDADLIFVLDRDVVPEEALLWTRLAEKTVEVLSSYTRDGRIFAVDCRLRPRGQEGDLLVKEPALFQYILEGAQAWEGLTYLKASPVAGNFSRGLEICSKLTKAILDRFGNSEDLEGEMQEMRRRLEREITVAPSNPKTAPGGYYDIEFTISYLRLRHRVAVPTGANMPDQIRALHQAGRIRSDDAAVLTEGAKFLRAFDHAVRLATGKAAAGLPEHVGHAELAENLLRRWELLPDNVPLWKRLREVQSEVRYVYRRLTGRE